MSLQLARSNIEAHLYMAIRPCDACGRAGDFAPRSSVIAATEGLASRYRGPCRHCAAPREFTFLLPDEILLPNHEEPEFGDDRPSVLLDAGEWLSLSDRLTAETPSWPGGRDAAACREILLDLRTAAAAVAEVLKFVPPGATAVPAEAFWTEAGRAAHAEWPERFVRARLEVLHASYREMSARFVT